MIKAIVPLLLSVCEALVLSACKTVVRENIISTIETGIGVTLAENPKTEMYEAKVGYIRSQFYSVPTGKNVEDEAGDKSHLSNAADITPEIVSGIRMESDARHLLLGVSVSESFAVGKIAVMSPAATAMYIADARNAANATAAATATKSVAESAATATIEKQDALIDDIIKFASTAANPPTLDPAKVDTLVANTRLSGQAATIKGLTPTQFKQKLQRVWDPFVKSLHNNIP